MRMPLLCSVLLARACTPLAVRHAPGTDVEAACCERLLDEVDRAFTCAGVADGGAARIAGFAYLRTDRFLASFAQAMSWRASTWTL
jgi:hypothetical protein